MDSPRRLAQQRLFQLHKLIIVGDGCSNVSPARLLAFDTLRKVGRGGYASTCWPRLGAARCARRRSSIGDCLGVLRYQGQLDFLIERLLRPRHAQARFRSGVALRMGVLPAALSGSCARARGGEPERRTGEDHRFHSGRRICQRRAAQVGASSRVPDGCRMSHPEWLLARWTRNSAPEVTPLLARANLRPPETYIRVPADAWVPSPCRHRDPRLLRLLAGRSCGSSASRTSARNPLCRFSNLAGGQRFLDSAPAPATRPHKPSIGRARGWLAISRQARAWLKTLG